MPTVQAAQPITSLGAVLLTRVRVASEPDRLITTFRIGQFENRDS